ncbi:Golgi CORVET complex core vacuolar protein 8-domain-containing protein [Cokeromyces recurvatus]|uniref:Golgi CORVET complex core vacuolar protein 8-domain-containing protein n=1 Tax=Cokeromyces recurvatus TaxID=90255 RepID=UPI00221F703A|nr:Golgi CORVET complex core vacuolar protein 8-domain-containing protein [Cokeromyces recurvatus]KAI7905949.1 Golgi CORVET complex core vacuolar protein 8-domain-containing protein [Cokeromyces recurvatus]
MNLDEKDADDKIESPVMEPSTSTSTIKFRRNYDTLLKEVLEESSDEDEELFNHIDIDLDTATAELPDDLRAALEDRALADKYLANLKNYMSHRRSQSINSEYSTFLPLFRPNTPLRSNFSNQALLSPQLLEHVQQQHHQKQQQKQQQPDPLLKVLNAVPYQTRLINGVPSLILLEQKFYALRIPELDLPVVSDTMIQTRLNGLYKIRDDLYIHLNGGPLVVNNMTQSNIGEKKKEKVLNLLDDITKEIGLYEEFVKKANYLSLESILNESSGEEEEEEEFSDTVNDSGSSLLNFNSPSELSKIAAETPSFLSASSSKRPSFSSPISSSQLSLQYLDSGTSSPQSSFDTLENQSNTTAEKENIEPWDAFKWTPLIKISSQLYSDQMKKENGLVSVIIVSGVIAIGTTRSLVFVYDYSQNLKCILGESARAIELGSVTSLAISSDHTTIACGHAQGHIVIWDIRRPHQPIRTIDPISPSQVAGALATPHHQAPRKEGHVKGAAILHIGFVGVKKSDIVSGDDQGMAFYHVLYKVIMVNAVDTTRISGRYQNISLTPKIQSVVARSRLQTPLLVTKPRKPNTVFAMQPLPLGQIPHPAENFGLVAILKPYKLIIVGLKPTPQTLYKFLKPRESSVHLDHKIDIENGSSVNVETLSGCLAWLPTTKLRNNTITKEFVKGKDNSLPLEPMLAFAWGKHLFIIRISVNQDNKYVTQNGRVTRLPATPPKTNKRGIQLEFVKIGEWKCRDTIVAIQWINKQIIVLFTPNEEMILFDPKSMTETQHTSIRTKQLVYHDWFNQPLQDLTSTESSETANPRSIEMAYFGSIKSYKGKLFLLGMQQLYIGTLLSWADRILALVQAGDFIESIELATSFYNGVGVQTVVGLPEDEKERKTLVGEQLMDLLLASLNYAFSSEHVYGGMTNEVVHDKLVVLYELAKNCIEACLSMNQTEFLFDTVYERFLENNVQGVFLEVLEPFIVGDRVPDIPPSIMKDFVDHYSKKRLLNELEQVIWHVNPHYLDIDQIVSMCHREGMYEAMMYVWNKSMHDYVSPVVEMLKVIRSVLREEAQNQDCSHKRQNAEKLFDYLKLILTGRSYPEGSSMLTLNEASDARSAVYSFVFSGRCMVWPPVGGKLILTADDEEGVSEPTYPYLRLLLRFSTKHFLEAMEVAFQDPWLNGGEDILSSKFEDEVPGKVISRQIIINTLLDVMGGGLTGNGLPLPPPRPKQSFSASTVHSISANTRPIPSFLDHPYDYVSNENIILLYIFIASNLHMYTTFILLPPKTLHKVLVRLAEDHDPDTRVERERAVQKLLTVYTPANEEQIVVLYEDAGFWKVLEDVYRRDKKYGKLVEAYLKDDERRNQVFDCFTNLLTSSELDDQQKEQVKRVFMIRISQFVEIDGQKTAYIVENFMNGNHTDAIRRLEEDQEFDDDEHHATADKHLFSYLRGLLEPYEEGKEGEEREEEEPLLSNGMHQGQMIEAHASLVDVSIQERYIELMCRFDPSGVYNYFNTRLNTTIPLDNALKSCEKYGVMDAVVWIMEKKGDTQGALEKMLHVAKDKNTTILQILKQHQTTQDSNWSYEELSMISSSLIGLNGVLRVSTRLCENSSRTHISATTPYQTGSDEAYIPELSYEDSSVGDDSTSHHEFVHNDQVETLWFQLLDAYVEGSIEIYNTLGGENDHQYVPIEIHQRITSSFKLFVQSILTSLLLSTSPQVSLPRLLLRLIHSQARGETTFADFRDVFLSMLDTYKYEGKLLEMTNKLFDRDVFSSLQDMVEKRGKGWRPARAVCEICGANILDLTLLQPPLAWGFEDEKPIEENDDDDDDDDDDERYVLFHCGHGFHTKCLEQQLGYIQECIVCQHGNPEAKPMMPPLSTMNTTEEIIKNTTKGKEKVSA